MKTFIRTFMPFLCGAVAAVNLSRLVETNPNYEAEWWKVALAIAFAIAAHWLAELME